MKEDSRIKAGQWSEGNEVGGGKASWNKVYQKYGRKEECNRGMRENIYQRNWKYQEHWKFEKREKSEIRKCEKC